MKKFTKLALVTLILTLVCTLTAALAACSSVSEITIEDKNMPRVTFVQGQEIDLTGGILTVKNKNKSEEIELTSKGVTISGYDKDTLGPQTLTVEYKGKTCELPVTVVARLVAENHDADYFVGEYFNRDKGRIRVYDDNALSTTVPLNDKSVTVEGDDFSSVGKVTLTVKYKNYTGGFTVNVYGIENSKITAPVKISYKSHDEGLDLAGVYLTLTGNGGKLVKQVPVTEDMVEPGSFDLSKATVDNINVPLVQKVKVNYLGKDFTFDVSISYSYVSLMKLRAKELSSLNWNVGIPEISETQGVNALEAVNGYFRLSDNDKALITPDEKTTVVRAAAVYGKDLYESLIDGCEKTFEIKEDGTYKFVKGSYNDALGVYNELSGTSASTVVLGEQLNNIAKEFANITLNKDTSVSGYIGNVYGAKNFDEILTGLEFMFALYEKLNAVPADWTNGKTAVADAIKVIANGGYNNHDCMDMYEAVSFWCRRSNMFDMFYAYCCDAKDTTSLKAISNIYIPEPFDELYAAIDEALSLVCDLADLKSLDSTDFMWLYNNILELADGITADADEEEKWLYENMSFEYEGRSLPFEGLIYYLAITDHGYYYNCYGSLGDEQFDAVWASYLKIMDGIYADKTYDGADVERLLHGFVEAAPSVQYAFIASINPYYSYLPHYSAIPEHAMNYEELLAPTWFIDILFDYYAGEDSSLSAASQSIFKDLLVALEDYSLRFMGDTKKDGTKVDYLDQFIKKTDGVKTQYSKLSADEKTAFDAKLGFFYDKYVAIREMYDARGNIQKFDLSAEEEADVKKLADTIDSLWLCYDWYLDGIEVYGAFIAGYEYAKNVADNLLADASEAVLNEYYYATHEFKMYGKLSLDSAMYSLREFYVKGLTDYDVWDEYRASSSDLKEFMINASPVMLMFLGSEGNEDFPVEYKDDVIKAINSFYPLGAEDKILFFGIDYTEDTKNRYEPFFLYDLSLQLYFKQNLGDKAFAAAIGLFDWEYYYASYVYNGKEEKDLAMLKSTKEKFDALYSSLGDELADFNEYLGGMYGYYSAAYEALGV